MKVLCISDIHGNIDALNAVWARESDSEAVICAGDIVDYGFNPHEVVEWFRSLTVPCYIVAGNHDKGVVSLYRKGITYTEQDAVSFGQLTALRLTTEDIDYLEALPEQLDFELDGYSCCMRHFITEKHEIKARYADWDMGRAFDEQWKLYRADSDAPNKRFILGHDHQSLYARIDGSRDWLDPGSLSYRLGSDAAIKGANYAVITDGEVVLRYTDFPRAHLRAMIEAHPTLTEKPVSRSFW